MTDEEIVELYFDRSENAVKETDNKYGASAKRRRAGYLMITETVKSVPTIHI